MRLFRKARPRPLAHSVTSLSWGSANAVLRGLWASARARGPAGLDSSKLRPSDAGGPSGLPCDAHRPPGTPGWSRLGRVYGATKHPGSNSGPCPRTPPSEPGPSPRCVPFSDVADTPVHCAASQLAQTMRAACFLPAGVALDSSHQVTPTGSQTCAHGARVGADKRWRFSWAMRPVRPRCHGLSALSDICKHYAVLSFS